MVSYIIQLLQIILVKINLHFRIVKPGSFSLSLFIVIPRVQPALLGRRRRISRHSVPWCTCPLPRALPGGCLLVALRVIMAGSWPAKVSFWKGPAVCHGKWPNSRWSTYKRSDFPGYEDHCVTKCQKCWLASRLQFGYTSKESGESIHILAKHPLWAMKLAEG